MLNKNHMLLALQASSEMPLPWWIQQWGNLAVMSQHIERHIHDYGAMKWPHELEEAREFALFQIQRFFEKNNATHNPTA